ncbi:hypothetical protein H4582DRAFT_1206674 [Lactarius indigo]|nr:hypothetical protein H4582DRAFT_1206674 [Lactarius indigo]
MDFDKATLVKRNRFGAMIGQLVDKVTVAVRMSAQALAVFTQALRRLSHGPAKLQVIKHKRGSGSGVPQQFLLLYKIQPHRPLLFGHGLLRSSYLPCPNSPSTAASSNHLRVFDVLLSSTSCTPCARSPGESWEGLRTNIILYVMDATRRGFYPVLVKVLRDVVR